MQQGGHVLRNADSKVTQAQRDALVLGDTIEPSRPLPVEHACRQVKQGSNRVIAATMKQVGAAPPDTIEGDVRGGSLAIH